MLARIQSASLLGVTGHVVEVEVHVASGLPSLTMVGLPDTACREARDRVRAAVASAEFAWPARRITVNLAPSGVPKIGTGLDLAIAVGVLVSTGVVPEAAVERRAFVGELGLDGSIRAVRGIVPLVAGVRHAVDAVVVPMASAAEASVVPAVEVLPAAHLGELVAVLKAERPWPDPPPARIAPAPPVPDLADVRGQPLARQAIEIAAAGGHHVLLSGPPGSGKTMLATRLPGLLPDLDDEAAMAVTAIHSAAGEPLGGGLLRRPPFRAPHHTASAVSLIGGGTTAMRPGEVSCAHQGVLFCDELGEFAPSVLDALRQPLEEGAVRVSRARATVSYPARFQLVAATNPCACGPGPRGCSCSTMAIARYLRRLSGPLLDRFDLRVDVLRPDPTELLSETPGEATTAVSRRVTEARALAATRGVPRNVDLGDDELRRFAALDRESSRLVEALVRDGSLTGRGVQRIRRVARTVADLAQHDGEPTIDHVATALAFRAMPGSERVEWAS